MKKIFNSPFLLLTLIMLVYLTTACQKEEIKPTYPDSTGQGVKLSATYANIGYAIGGKTTDKQALANIYDGEIKINEAATFNGVGFTGKLFKQGGGHVLPEKTSGGKKIFENHKYGWKTYVFSIDVLDTKYSDNKEQNYFTASTYIQVYVHQDSAFVGTVYFPAEEILNDSNKTKNRFLLETDYTLKPDNNKFRAAIKANKVFWNGKIVSLKK